MALGRKNYVIAEEFGISVGTVKVCVMHLLDKLAATDRTQVAYRAAGIHLLSGEEPQRSRHCQT